MKNDLMSRGEAEQRITLVMQELTSQCKTERQDNAVTMLWKRLIDALRDTPTISPDSLRERGRWIIEPANPYGGPARKNRVVKRCSCCGWQNACRYNYCPSCGGRMDLEET